MSPNIYRYLDPGVAVQLPYLEHPLDVDLRVTYGVEHVLLASVHPSALPEWARTLIGGDAAVISARRVATVVSGTVFEYEIDLPSDSSQLDRLNTLLQTGHSFVLLTRRRAGVVAETLYWIDGGPVRLFGSLCRSYVGGAILGAISVFLAGLLKGP